MSLAEVIPGRSPPATPVAASGSHYIAPGLVCQLGRDLGGEIDCMDVDGPAASAGRRRKQRAARGMDPRPRTEERGKELQIEN